MNFEEEMNDVSKAETSANYITEACVELVTLKSYKMSPKDHKGKPYIEFTFETCDDKKSINSTRLYRVNADDSPEVKEWKNKALKDLLSNANADWNKKGEEVIKSAIGNKIKALFKKVEYVGVDANQKNKPVVKTKIEYSFSGHPDNELKGNQSYMFKPLKDKDQKKLEGDLAKWKRDNPEGTSENTEKISEENKGESGEEDDGLPF